MGKEDKYKAEKEYWQICHQEIKSQLTQIRAWIRENVPDVWQKCQLPTGYKPAACK